MTRTKSYLAASVASLGLGATLLGATAATAATGPVANPSADRGGVCDVDRCKVVARVNVAGDGRAETVAIRWFNERQGRLIVQMPSGKRLTHDFRAAAPDTARTAFHGTGPVDGARGHEIVLTRESGAHTQWHQMFTVKNGKLMRQLPPTTEPTPLWRIDGSASVYEGYLRIVRKDGTVVLKQRRASLGSTGTFQTKIKRFVWDGGWRPAGTINFSMSPASAANLGGYRGAFGPLPPLLSHQRSPAPSSDGGGSEPFHGPGNRFEPPSV